MPHRAHVLRRGQDPRRARDDPRRQRRPSGAARSTRSCRCSARTSTASSARWTGCRSPSACSIRRCTSSCRRRTRRSQSSPSELGVTPDVVRARVAALHEANPMLGHRGCRLAITYPEIYETQVRAIIEAAVRGQRAGVDVQPEIMIPLVGHERELAHHARAGGRAPPTPCSRERGAKIAVHGRHHDRAAARLRGRRRARRARRLLLASAPTTSRRPRSASRATTPRSFLGDYVEPRHLPGRSVRRHRSGRRRRSSSASASSKGRARQARPQDRHLRRARRRALVGGVLPPRSASTT